MDDILEAHFQLILQKYAVCDDYLNGQKIDERNEVNEELENCSC
jgi:hypothetical protein